MNRRELLLGGAAGAATLGLSSKAEAARQEEPGYDPVEVESALERIDLRMQAFLEMDPSLVGQGNLTPERARLARAAIRTLYFTGAFMELEEHQRCHPGVQDRMRRMQGEMDHAMSGMADLLEGLSPEELRKLQQGFHKDPEVAMRVGELLNRVAQDDGFGYQRRKDLRLAFGDASRRMGAQNPAVMIDPLLKKARRVMERPQSDAERERALRIRAGEEAFWAFEDRSKKSVAAWDAVYAARPRTDVALLTATYPDEEASEPAPTDEEDDGPGSRPRRVIRTGGTLMGLGLLSIGAGGFFYLVSTFTTGAAQDILVGIAVVLGITVGPILIVVGLVILLVGAIWYAVDH